MESDKINLHKFWEFRLGFYILLKTPIQHTIDEKTSKKMKITKEYHEEGSFFTGSTLKQLQSFIDEKLPKLDLAFKIEEENVILNLIPLKNLTKTTLAPTIKFM
eukprot:gene11373-4541_t